MKEREREWESLYHVFSHLTVLVYGLIIHITLVKAYKGKKKAWIKTKQGIKQEKKSKTHVEYSSEVINDQPLI